MTPTVWPVPHEEVVGHGQGRPLGGSLAGRQNYDNVGGRFQFRMKIAF